MPRWWIQTGTRWPSFAVLRCCCTLRRENSPAKRYSPYSRRYSHSWYIEQWYIPWYIQKWYIQKWCRPFVTHPRLYGTVRLHTIYLLTTHADRVFEGAMRTGMRSMD